MKKVLLLVEGQTEEQFVTEVLRPDLRARGVELVPVLLKTKRVKAGGHFRGGVTNYASARRDVQLLLGDKSAALVSSILDLYGLPDDFPGASQKAGTPAEWAMAIEEAWRADVANDRFRPYLSVHEFEAFAFVAPARCVTVFAPDQISQLENVRDQFRGQIENINDGNTTHPAARVVAIRPGYEKPIHGALIAMETGLEALGNASPHFARFLKMLRDLTGGQG